MTVLDVPSPTLATFDTRGTVTASTPYGFATYDTGFYGARIGSRLFTAATASLNSFTAAASLPPFVVAASLSAANGWGAGGWGRTAWGGGSNAIAFTSSPALTVLSSSPSLAVLI